MIPPAWACGQLSASSVRAGRAYLGLAIGSPWRLFIQTGGARRVPPVIEPGLLAHRRSGRFDMGLDRVEVEARTFLHGWVLDGGLGQFDHLLLDKHEAPELELEPLE